MLRPEGMRICSADFCVQEGMGGSIRREYRTNAGGDGLHKGERFLASGIGKGGLAHEFNGLPRGEAVCIFGLLRLEVFEVGLQAEETLPFFIGDRACLTPLEQLGHQADGAGKHLGTEGFE